MKNYDLKQTTASPFEVSPKIILFEDADIVVVNKPSGLPTQGTLDKSRPNLFDKLREYYQKAAALEGVEAYLGMHHRLDLETSGIVLFTRSKRANKNIAEQFQQHTIRKTYQALVVAVSNDKSNQTVPPGHWTIENHLGAKTNAGTRKLFTAVRSNGQKAITHFKIMESLKSTDGTAPVFYWVEAKPHTGRTHQIRVHLAEYGLPILGDRDYGQGRDQWAKRVMLHAAELELQHPITGDNLKVLCPVPADFKEAWDKIQSIRIL